MPKFEVGDIIDGPFRSYLVLAIDKGKNAYRTRRLPYDIGSVYFPLENWIPISRIDNLYSINKEFEANKKFSKDLEDLLYEV